MRFLHLLCIALFFICSLLNAQQVISLWPNGVPDEIINPNYSERVETKDEAGNPTRISRVTSPSLTIYHAPKENASGAAVGKEGRLAPERETERERVTTHGAG